MEKKRNFKLNREIAALIALFALLFWMVWHSPSVLLNWLHVLSDFWVFLTAIGTILMAVTTGIVIRQNSRVILDSESQMAQSERHHHDAFMPMLVIVPSRNTFSPRTTANMLGTYMRDGAAYYQLDGTVKNIGSGLALNGSVVFVFPSTSYYCTDVSLLPPIGVQDTYGMQPEKGYTEFAVKLSDNFNETDFRLSVSYEWMIVIQFSDVFGNSFYTIHNKNGLPMWVTFHRGNLSLRQKTNS